MEHIKVGKNVKYGLLYKPSNPTPEEYFSNKIKKDPGYEYIFSKWKEEKEAGREVPAYDYWSLKLYLMDQEADKEKK